MNEIGGYFQLELNNGDLYHDKAEALNTGRNCFEYILKANNYDKVFIPKYSCDALLESIQKCQIDYLFYDIDERFKPIINFDEIQTNEAFLYINYFGLFDRYINELKKKEINIIIDNSQAFYNLPIKNIDTFYSPRKFFGVSDGGFLYSNNKLNETFLQDTSYRRILHLIGRLEKDANTFFEDFKKTEKELSNQTIKSMSGLTKALLKNIDFQIISRRRRSNFVIYQNALSENNSLDIKLFDNQVPLCYPFFHKNGEQITNELKKNKIFVPCYWEDVKKRVKKTSFEFKLTKNLVSLPIDQRYNIRDINRVISVLSPYL